ncbi:MAG TPA: YciI family protein [Myxococcota bacterium]|nr:YciI family protein [Myxococcota bacterium]
MKYAILCYSDESLVTGLSKAQDAAMMETIGATSAELQQERKLGAAVRLMPTSAALTVRHGGGEPAVLDGPFAETKEQLLGLYLVECESLDDAIDAARRLAKGRTPGSLEIRPVRSLRDYGPLA